MQRKAAVSLRVAGRSLLVPACVKPAFSLILILNSILLISSQFGSELNKTHPFPLGAKPDLDARP